MTHIENVAHILKHGITQINSPNKNPNYVPIGDGGLIANRDKFTMPNGNKLGTYIPFYFGPRMPMLFVIQKEYNNVQRTPSQNIVYCITSVQKILDHQFEFVYTNGHAVDRLTDFFDSDKVDDILNVVDMTAVKAEFWIDEKDLDKKRRKEAEFLLATDLSVSTILGYAVYNQDAMKILINLGVEENKIVVRPDYYF